MKTGSPPKRLMFSSFLLFFVILANQVGTGLSGFQRIIYQSAGHDAWISVCMAGAWSHLTVGVMLRTLKLNPNMDLYEVHKDLYGRYFGGIINTIVMLYMLTAVMVLSRNYVEMVQTWIFPDLPTWLLSAFLAMLIIYGVLGGIRIVVGIALMSVILTIWLIVFLYFPLRYAEWTHLTPIMEASISELVQGMLKMSLTIVGFEILMFVYPFIRNKEHAPLAAHLGLFTTTIIYVAVMVVTLVYFSPGQLSKTVWATFSLFKIVVFPFLERFEYVAICVWMLVVLPNLMMYMWAASKGIKRIFGWKQKYALYTFALILVVVSIFFKTRIQINTLNDIFSKVALYFVFGYPWVLYAAVLLKRHFQMKRGGI
ncbi:GerAB/ArcD/ProY family transporter [Paenibacillus sp. LMG 31458]|uniref:GerAB/ArcD/ProY family transporter n=1 Tax=Paenibacillus phytorum TaxID=2654977 RepID=A0ABX1XW95_9BACL|nr:GerAB/ArcD/ProY family transporter [Paenibacillus phytorum]NOU72835.1 GerAB/ArcD/ProY family transporter [Paenibacillus phytorum]